MDCSILWQGLDDGSLSAERRSQDRWQALADRFGRVAGRPFLLGIRGVRLGAKESAKTRSVAVYDDSFCLYYPSGGIYLFAGSTHAFQTFSKASPDVDGDGIGDVATIVPGAYDLKWSHDDSAGCPIFVVLNPDGSTHIKCLRDTKHSGVAVTPSYATEILFHTGPFDSPANASHKYSIGCQTTGKHSLVEMKSVGLEIPYVMVTAETAVEVAQQIPAFVDTEPSPPEFV